MVYVHVAGEERRPRALDIERIVLKVTKDARRRMFAAEGCSSLNDVAERRSQPTDARSRLMPNESFGMTHRSQFSSSVDLAAVRLGLRFGNQPLQRDVDVLLLLARNRIAAQFPVVDDRSQVPGGCEEGG